MKTGRLLSSSNNYSQNVNGNLTFAQLYEITQRPLPGETSPRRSSTGKGWVCVDSTAKSHPQQKLGRSIFSAWYKCLSHSKYLANVSWMSRCFFVLCILKNHRFYQQTWSTYHAFCSMYTRRLNTADCCGLPVWEGNAFLAEMGPHPPRSSGKVPSPSEHHHQGHLSVPHVWSREQSPGCLLSVWQQDVCLDLTETPSLPAMTSPGLCWRLPWKERHRARDTTGHVT